MLDLVRIFRENWATLDGKTLTIVNEGIPFAYQE
jgi:hypothetical protein